MTEEEANSTAPPPTTVEYQCHETFETSRFWMAGAQFWVEGVILLVVGIFGIVGNVMTIFILRRIDSNTTFNRLLMSLGESVRNQGPRAVSCYENSVVRTFLLLFLDSLISSRFMFTLK